MGLRLQRIARAAGRVHSLALDEISVSSHLGQPLEAVIPVNGAAGELLDSACFSVCGGIGRRTPGIEAACICTSIPSRGNSRCAPPSPCSSRSAKSRSVCAATARPDWTGPSSSCWIRPTCAPQTVFARTREATSQPATNRSAFAARGRRLCDAFGSRTSHPRARERDAGAPALTSHASIEPTIAIAPGSAYRIQVGDTLSGHRRA